MKILEWLNADWKRWLILPAALAGLMWLAKRASLVLWPHRKTDPGVGTLTPEQGEDARDAADRKADAAISEIRRRAEEDKAKGRDLYGGES